MRYTPFSAYLPVLGFPFVSEKIVAYFLFTTVWFQSICPRHVIQRIGHLDRRNPIFPRVSALYDNTSDGNGLSKIYLTRQCVNRSNNYQQVTNKQMDMNIYIKRILTDANNFQTANYIIINIHIPLGAHRDVDTRFSTTTL